MCDGGWITSNANPKKIEMADKCKYCGYFGKHTNPCYEELVLVNQQQAFLLEEAIEILMIVVDCDCQTDVALDDVEIWLKHAYCFRKANKKK